MSAAHTPTGSDFPDAAERYLYNLAQAGSDLVLMIVFGGLALWIA
jgi:hypothetical protein